MIIQINVSYAIISHSDLYGQVLMTKKIKIIISLICYTLATIACIILITRFFNTKPKQESIGEVIYDGIELSAPLYPSTPGSSVMENRYASIDFSNTSQGYFSICYKGGSEDEPVMKVNYGETEYVYSLAGEDVFPLTCGDGKYTVRVYKMVSGGKYKSVLTKELSVKLENQLLPYLYPSQLVSYSDTSLAVQLSREMCGETEGDLDKLKAIYGYIIENITYDYKKAANVKSGYIPSVDSTFITKSGICFDYSVMMAAMLRTQRVPVKLVMGYLNGTSVFHAWNEVYLKDRGWVTVNIFVDEKIFNMLDTTLAASQSDDVIAKKLSDPEVYLPVYKY